MIKFVEKKFKNIFNEKKTLKRLIKIPSPTIVDIGGNIGQTCIQIKKLFPKSKIHTLEPIPEVFEKLKENTKKLNKIKYYNFGLGNKNKKIYINMNKFNNKSSSSFISFNKNSISRKKNYHPKLNLNQDGLTKQKVEMKKSDYFFNKIKKVDYCKIDTQGYEFFILKSIADKNFKKIKSFKIELMLDDVYNYDSQKNFSKIINLLINKNFYLYDISNIYKNLNDSRVLWVDAFFVNKNFYKVNC